MALTRTFRRVWIIRLIGVLGVVTILLSIVTLVAGAMLGRKLVGMVEQHASARLRLDRVYYLPPYGLTVRGFHLYSPGPDGNDQDILDIDQVKLTLAELPARSRPLLIEGLDLRNPVLHITREAQGKYAGDQIVKKPEKPADEVNGQKISDVLRLRHLSVENARAIVTDLTKKDARAMQWGGVDLHVQTTARSPSSYMFQLDASSEKLVELQGAGTFDVDEPSLTLDTFSLSSQVRHEQPPSQLPPKVQEILTKYAVDGRLKINGSAQLSKKNAGGTNFDATVHLDQASAYEPRAQAKLDSLVLMVKTTGRGTQISAEISELSASIGGSTLALKERATINFDTQSHAWSVGGIDGVLKLAGGNLPGVTPSLQKIQARGTVNFTAAADGRFGRAEDHIEVLAYPEKLSIDSPKLSATLADITGGPIHLAGGIVSVNNLTARFGPDALTLKTARLALSPLKQRVLQWTDITGSILMGSPCASYPNPVGKIFASIRPAGQFDVAGALSIDPKAADPKSRVNYDLLISSDHGKMTLTDRNIAITEIKGDTELFRDHLEIKRMQCNALGGQLSGHGVVSTHKPITYSGEIFGENLRLPEIADALRVHSNNKVKLEGLAAVQMKFNGSGPQGGRSALDLLVAQGQAEVYRGDFWEFPIFSKIADKTHVAQDALTVAEAAAYFDLADQSIKLDDAAVNAPVLGLTGSGTVSFKGDLDLEIVVAPLADWRDGLKKTGIPIISDFAGEVFGKVQDFLNTATGNLLYEFRVTGPAGNPDIATVPAPILTRGTAKVFGNMLGQDDKKRPIELLEGQPATNKSGNEN